MFFHLSERGEADDEAYQRESKDLVRLVQQWSHDKFSQSHWCSQYLSPHFRVRQGSNQSEDRRRCW